MVMVRYVSNYFWRHIWLLFDEVTPIKPTEPIDDLKRAIFVIV